jgi:REP element-mobilizing transposase RayT
VHLRGQKGKLGWRGPYESKYPGAFYHVMNRGNTGMALFRSEGDRERFLEYVGHAVTRYDIKVHNYCLMSTHYHFLIETPQANLSQAVKWINVAYSVYFNRKRRRVGHLFQGRFKAVLVEADEYLKQLSRYIHICGAAIAIRHSQIANQLPSDRKLKRWIDRIRKQILNI